MNHEGFSAEKKLEILRRCFEGTENIRDVIAFPKIKDASCLMTQAPNVVPEKQLEELCISIKENTEE